MKKQGIFKNKRITYLFESYVLIAFLTILFNSVAYVSIDNMVARQNEHYVNEILENKRNRIDNLCKITRNFAMELSKSSLVQDVAFNAYSTIGTDYQKILDAKRDIDQYRGIEYEFSDYYIYFHHINYCIGKSTCCDADRFFDIQVTEDKINRDEWFQYMQKNDNGQFVVAKTKKGYNVFYLLSVYGNERFVPYATVAVNLSADSFILPMENKKFNEKFFVVDENNKIILSDDVYNVTQVQSILNKNGVKIGITDFEKNTMVAVKSADTGFSYLYFVDKAVFKRTVNMGRLVVILANLICLGIVICIAVILSKKNYKPLGNIMKLFVEDNDTGDDEFKFIARKITDVIQKNKEFSEMSEKIDNKSVRGALMARLLNDGVNEEVNSGIIDTLECLNVKFDAKYFIVVLFYIEITADMFFESSENSFEENYSLSRFVLTNVFSELCGEDYKINYCEINGFLCCIINSKDKGGSEFVADKIKWMQRYVIENLNINFCAGISVEHSFPEQLSECYAEALSCINQRFYKYNTIAVYKEPVNTEINDLYISKKAANQLTELIQNSNYELCEKLINKIFAAKIQNVNKPIQAVKCILYDLTMVVIKTVTEIGGVDDATITELVEFIENVGVNVDVNSIREKLLDILKRFCESIERKTLQRLDIVLENVREYVDAKYREQNLSVSMIAEHFDISTPYLSTNFKKKYQVGLAEHIVNVRIEKAKKLLRESDLTVEVISAEVGYVNPRSFFRSFVRIVGCTPNEYRKSAN